MKKTIVLLSVILLFTSCVCILCLRDDIYNSKIENSTNKNIVLTLKNVYRSLKDSVSTAKDKQVEIHSNEIIKLDFPLLFFSFDTVYISYNDTVWIDDKSLASKGKSFFNEKYYKTETDKINYKSNLETQIFCIDEEYLNSLRKNKKMRMNTTP